jgi:hypothetical protein
MAASQEDRISFEGRKAKQLNPVGPVRHHDINEIAHTDLKVDDTPRHLLSFRGENRQMK